jgi:hypothetical protein
MSTNKSNKSNKKRRPNVDGRRFTSATAGSNPTSQTSAADSRSTYASRMKRPRNVSNVEKMMKTHPGRREVRNLFKHVSSKRSNQKSIFTTHSTRYC